MNYGKELQQRRESKGISKYRLEQLSGVPRMTISRIENGSVAPSIDLYNRILASLDAELAIKTKGRE